MEPRPIGQLEGVSQSLPLRTLEYLGSSKPQISGQGPETALFVSKSFEVGYALHNMEKPWSISRGNIGDQRQIVHLSALKIYTSSSANSSLRLQFSMDVNIFALPRSVSLHRELDEAQQLSVAWETPAQFVKGRI